MEQNLAILFADLSGYTALTEAHGAVTAADIVDNFVAMATSSLVGTTRLHQRIGDEVMIVSESPDELVDTAIILLQSCRKQHGFLQLHGGLHFGTVLKRDDQYYGAPINLTSRIAVKATTGKFWCSSPFVNSLSNPHLRTFKPQGTHNFKNVSAEMEVFELVLESAEHFYIDPICRMLLHHHENLIPHPSESEIFFCSGNCRDIYLGGKSI